MEGFETNCRLRRSWHWPFQEADVGDSTLAGEAQTAWGERGTHRGEALPFSLKVQEDVRGGLSLLPSPEDNPPEWKRRGLC